MIKNILLVAIFGLQHSLMARPAFKQKWTRFVAKPVERSTYLLFTFFALGLLMWQWEPVGGVVWSVAADSPVYWAFYTVFALGWMVLFTASFLINHFDLFGLRQVYLYMINKPYAPLVFKEKLFYKSFRHPIYTGLVMGIWFTPNMTISHLFLAVLLTGYILYAITLEERDLINEWGEKYTSYMERTGGLLPNLWKMRQRRFSQSQSKT